MNFLMTTKEDTGGEDTMLYDSNNVDSMETLLDYCLKYSETVKTIAIYEGGEHKTTLLNEGK